MPVSIVRCFLALSFVCALPSTAVAQKTIVPAGLTRRVALVIGNNTYPWGPLDKAVSDAQSIQAALPGLGFSRPDIFFGTNLSLKDFQRLRRQFLDSLKPGDLAFVYYSGHGLEATGTNYMVPVDFPANATESQAADEAVSAQELLSRMVDTGASVRIMVLDACRNNPLRKVRSMGGGLSAMDRVTGRGTLVLFATEAGRTAADNGLVSKHLIRQLSTPGLPVDQAIKKVALAVDAETGGQQTPTPYGLLLQDFAFVEGPRRPDGNTGARAPVNADEEAWDIVKDTDRVEPLRQFIAQYPNSRYKSVAQLKIQVLESKSKPVGGTTPGAPKVDPTVVGTWSLQSQPGVALFWQVLADGHYTLTGQITDAGTIEAHDGEWTTKSQMLPAPANRNNGSYSVRKGILSTTAVIGGAATWQRVVTH